MKILKRIVSALLLAVMLSGAAMAAAYKANVITGSMKVYNQSREHIGSLPQGTEFYVTAISENKNWARISYCGKTGYASMQNILFQKRIPVVSVRNASMRFVTKASFKLGKAFTATIAPGTHVYMVGYYNGYLLIENSTGSGLGVVKASDFKRI